MLSRDIAAETSFIWMVTRAVRQESARKAPGRIANVQQSR
jgi:hypothetical protein